MEGRQGEDTQGERHVGMKAGRGHVSTSQGMPKVASKAPEAGRKP